MVNIRNKAKPDSRVRVVEDQAILFAVVCAETATDDLDVKHFRFCWPGEDDAGHERQVRAGRHAADVHNDLDVAVPQSMADGPPLVSACVGVHVGGRNARFFELLLQLLGVSAIDSEAESWSVLALLKPRLNHVSHEVRLLHLSRELPFVPITRNRADLREVRLNGRGKRRNGDKNPLSISSWVVAAMMRSSKCLPSPFVHGVAESPMNGTFCHSGRFIQRS